MEILETPKGRGSTRGVHLIQNQPPLNKLSQGQGYSLFHTTKKKQQPPSSSPRTPLRYRIKAASIGVIYPLVFEQYFCNCLFFIFTVSQRMIMIS
jgi:hypothetical protein